MDRQLALLVVEELSEIRDDLIREGRSDEAGRLQWVISKLLRELAKPESQSKLQPKALLRFVAMAVQAIDFYKRFFG